MIRWLEVAYNSQWLCGLPKYRLHFTMAFRGILWGFGTEIAYNPDSLLSLTIKNTPKQIASALGFYFRRWLGGWFGLARCVHGVAVGGSVSPCGGCWWRSVCLPVCVVFARFGACGGSWLRCFLGGLCLRIVLGRSFALSRRVSLSFDKVLRQNKKAVKIKINGSKIYRALRCDIVGAWFRLWLAFMVCCSCHQGKKKAGQGRALLRSWFAICLIRLLRFVYLVLRCLIGRDCLLIQCNILTINPPICRAFVSMLK